MLKRFNNPFNTPVFLASAIGMVLFVSSVSFSAETYPIPQTAEVRLAWDPNDPAPDGYRIYQRAEGESYEYGQPVWTGPDNSGTVYNLERDTTYYYVVRAYAGSQESADSEEVSFVAALPEPTTYTILTATGGHGSISPGGTVVVSKDADHTFSMIPEIGYQVIDVNVDGQSKGAISSYTFSQVGANHTIDASFAVNTYNISAVAGANGNISPVGITSIDHGASQTFTIAPDEGYRVSNVIVDGVAKGAILSYTFEAATGSHTISADFAVDTYAITASTGTNGSIFPSGVIRVDKGGSESYTNTPAIGYRVADVLVDGVSMGAVNTFTFKQIEVDHTIHTTFTAEMFAITATAGANGAITPAGVVDVPYGGSQTYDFAVNREFCIADVQVDGTSVGAVGSYTFSDVKSPHTISVDFSESMVVQIQIEAEDGDLVWPMEIGGEEGASAGGFIWVFAGAENLYIPSANAGYAEYHFDVPETGDYVVWGRQISNDTDSDSLFVSVDGQAEMIWKTKLSDMGVWTWDVVSSRTDDDSRDATNPKKYRLEAGFHTLKIRYLEEGVRLDTMVITNDLSMGVSELEAPSQAPIIEVGPYNQCISELAIAALSLNVTDPANGILTYAWELPDGGSIVGDGQRVEFVPEAIGPHASPCRVNVVVSSDASMQSSAYTFYFYVKRAGDINGDGYVDFADLAQLRADFGEIGEPGLKAGDVNRDGYVNFADLAILRSQFGQNGCACP